MIVFMHIQIPKHSGNKLKSITRATERDYSPKRVCTVHQHTALPLNSTLYYYHSLLRQAYRPSGGFFFSSGFNKAVFQKAYFLADRITVHNSPAAQQNAFNHTMLLNGFQRVLRAACYGLSQCLSLLRVRAGKR